MTFEEGHGPAQLFPNDIRTASIAMRLREYLVLKRHGRWCIKMRGRFSAPYPNEAAAIQGAIGRADLSGKSGQPAMVALFARPYGFKTIKIVGQHPYTAA